MMESADLAEFDHAAAIDRIASQEAMDEGRSGS
jgi:hypothetical protein